MYMVITIRDLQPIKSDTNNEIWQELNSNELDQIKGGNALLFAAALGFTAGAVTTAGAVAAGVAVGAAIYYATSGFVPGPNDEGKYILR
jgi:hypothetical protein